VKYNVSCCQPIYIYSKSRQQTSSCFIFIKIMVNVLPVFWFNDIIAMCNEIQDAFYKFIAIYNNMIVCTCKSCA